MKFTKIHQPKTLVLRKIDLTQSSPNPYTKQFETLFNDPSSYLRLPGESEFPFVVGKKLSGPRYDADDQVIPYSIVGNPRIFKKRNLNSNFSRTSSTYSRTIRENTKGNESNSHIVTDKELNNIFTRCKDNIETNFDRGNEFLTSIPPNVNENAIKPLLLQQKIIEQHEENEKIENNISSKIKRRLNLHKFSHKSPRKELLMDSLDSFRVKKDTMEYIQKNEDFVKKYGSYHWAIGLRRPKNFKGIRENHINIGSNTKPVWCTIRERLPVVNETIINPRFDWRDKKIIDNESLESYMKTTPSLINFMNKTMNMNDLEIKGKDLLKVEEENAKSLKGKKKLLHLKYDKDSIKDLNFVENWK